MSSLNTTLILGMAFLAIYLQATFDPFRNLTGAQFDLLPSLMVYCALSAGLPSITALAVLGGLCLDSLSANPLGISILPLFLIGFVIQNYRSLILRDQFFAQWLLGLGASAAAPAVTLLLLLNRDPHPLLGWGSLWYWLVVSLVGAAAAPLWFQFFGLALHAVNYRPITQTSFRPDREIKRGRF